MTDRTLFSILVAALAIVVGGCIVSDQITTLTIHEDGSAEWIRFQSNIHSSEPGEKGAEELRHFVDAFDRREDDDFRRLAAAGGQVKDARWLRRDEPCANVVVATLPGAPALQAFYTIKDEKDEPVTRARFSKSGARRRFSIFVPASKGENEPAAEKSFQELRHAQANGVSETRIAVTGGRIVDAAGFTVADDRRSAVLEPTGIQGLTAAAENKEIEIFLEWELADGGAGS